eukprot:6713905-Pyramimonas_sp.AAC.1
MDQSDARSAGIFSRRTNLKTPAGVQGDPRDGQDVAHHLHQRQLHRAEHRAGIFSLPFCDWCPLRVYSFSPPSAIRCPHLGGTLNALITFTMRTNHAS